MSNKPNTRAEARTPDRTTRSPSSGPPIFAIAIGALVVVAIAVFVVIRLAGGDSDDSDAAGSGSEATQAFAPVTATGEPLAEHAAGAEDPAVGQAAPVLEGEDPTGEAVTVDPAADGPMVIVFVAHWCPHCQAEVPRIVDLVDDNGELDGVKVVAVSTAADPEADNYPPGDWLDEESWPGPVLLDDEEGTAATSYGLSGFPYLVAIDADGNVVARASGEQGEDRLRALFEAARSGEAPEG